MNPAGALAFPSGRAVAGWWRQLTGYQPQSLWIGHLLLHCVEALVEQRGEVSLGPGEASLLKLLHIRGSVGVAELAERLFVDRPLARRHVSALRSRGWVAFDQDDLCQLTRSGRAVSEAGTYATQERVRRAFYFLEPDRLLSAPAFLALGSGCWPEWAAGPEWRFDPRELETCVRRSPEWKMRHGFPQDVVAVYGAGGVASDDPAAAWQEIIVDQPERLPAVLVLTTGPSGPECLGFAFQEHGWHLQASTPVFRLGSIWAETFPELVEPIAADAWRHAWEDWLRSRGIAVEETASCRLEGAGHELHLYAPSSLVQRLRTALRPAVQGDIWLLAGNGRFRQAVHVQIHGSPS